MPGRYLQLDDLRRLNSPEQITDVFRKLGYSPIGESLDVTDLQLSPRNAEAVMPKVRGLKIGKQR